MKKKGIFRVWFYQWKQHLADRAFQRYERDFSSGYNSTLMRLSNNFRGYGLWHFLASQAFRHGAAQALADYQRFIESEWPYHDA